MTTFQAIVFGIIQSFSEFLPVSSSAHRVIIPYLLNWPEPNGAFIGALALGNLLSVLFYFRHDWASMISCFIQVILFRKKPMTLDERLPLFLMISTLPMAAGWYYLRVKLAEVEWSPILVAGSLAFFGLPLWISESMSRKNKGMFDWNWLDALSVGITQVFGLVPGCGRINGSLVGAFFRNYNREAAAKYSFYALGPVLGATVIHHLRGISIHAAAPMPNVSWMTFIVTVLVTLLTGLLAIGGFMKQIQRKGFGQYVGYRFLLAATVLAVYWFRSRNTA